MIIFTLLFPIITDPEKQIKLADVLYLNDGLVWYLWEKKISELSSSVLREIIFVENMVRKNIRKSESFALFGDSKELTLHRTNPAYKEKLQKWLRSDATYDEGFVDRAFLEKMIPDQPLPH